MTNQDFPVLLVEDDMHDVRFVERSWRVNHITNPLLVVPHGQACLEYLRREGDYGEPSRSPRPGIILMDVRMPVMDGIECLRVVKSDPQLRTIPVVMLTTSKEDEDRVRSYELGCNTFIQKPVDFDKLAAAVRTIHLYWTLSELP
jgi:CheY-like chemotaxis protein